MTFYQVPYLKCISFLSYLLCIILGVIFFTSKLQSQIESQETDTVSFQFKWPDGLKARIEANIFRNRLSGETAESSSTSVQYNMEVFEQPDKDLIIRFSDFTLPDTSINKGTPAYIVSKLIASLMPSFNVSPRGKFRGVYNYDAMRNYLIDTLLSVIITDKSIDQVRNLLNSDFLEETFQAIAQNEWSKIVEFWLDANLEVGATYRMHDTLGIASLPGVDVPTVIHFGAIKRQPCNINENSPFCVELWYDSRPDSGSLASVVQKYMDRVNSAFLKNKRQSELTIVEQVDFVTQINLVTRPESLTPIEFKFIKFVEVLSRKGEERTYEAQLEQRVYRYIYN